MKLTKFTMRSVNKLDGQLKQAQQVDKKYQTEETRLRLSNINLRSTVAHELAGDSRTTSLLARHALSSTVRKQLDAAETDCIKGLKTLVRIRRFIDVWGNPDATDKEKHTSRLPASMLDVIASYTAAQDIQTVYTVRDRVYSRLTGKPLDATPIRNTLRALHTLGLIRSTLAPHARYIQAIADHGLYPSDWSEYSELITIAVSAGAVVPESVSA